MIGGQKTAAATLLLAVFVAGALGGAVGVKMVNRRPWGPRGESHGQSDLRGGLPSGPGGPQRPPERFGVAPMWLADRLAAELLLSQEQKKRVTAVMESRQAHTSEVLEETGAFLRAQLDSMHLEIRAILTPDQQERLDDFRSRPDERMFRRGGGMPRPGTEREGFPEQPHGGRLKPVPPEGAAH